MTGEKDETNSIRWDIPDDEGNGLERLSPEILRNRIRILQDEVTLHRAAIYEVLVMVAQLVNYERAEDEETKRHIHIKLVKSVQATAKAMRFWKDEQDGT